MAFVESTVLCLVDSLSFLRWGFWWFNTSFRQIGYCDLSEDLLPGHGQGCIFREATTRCFTFTDYLAFLLFLLEGISGGFSSGLLLLGFVAAVRVQLLFISDVGFAISWNSLRVLGRSSRTAFLTSVPSRRPLVTRYCFMESSAPLTWTASLLNLSM